MPNWKKLIVSGSDATLSNLDVTNSVTASHAKITGTSYLDGLVTIDHNLNVQGSGVIKMAGTEVISAARLINATSGTFLGQVGIGTASPDSLLHLNAASEPQVRIENSDTYLTEGQVIGGLIFKQNDSTSGGAGISGRVQMRASRRPDNNGYFGTVSDMDFLVSSASNGAASDNATKTAMSIRAGTGNIGIGTITPGASLEVVGNISASGAITASAFVGDGSALTNIVTTIQSSSTAASEFTSQTTHSVSHNLSTTSPLVQVYDSNNELFIPTKVKIVDSNTVTVFMDPATTGQVTVANAGHVISGSADYSLLINTPSGIISGAAQTVAHLPTNTVSGSSQVVSLLSGQNLTLGEVSASKLHTTVVSSSIAFSSGSNIFGDELTDVHQITGSLNVTGSANLTASHAVNHRDSSGLKFWAGSQAQYDALGSYDSNKLYFVT